MAIRFITTSVLVFVGIGLVAGRSAAADPVIDGVYKCVGDNGDGTNYDGSVKITKGGGTYEIRWTIGGVTHVGVGFFENDRLCCSYAFPTNNGIVTGVVVYKVEKNKLVGKFTAWPGNGKILIETLTKAE